MPREYPPEALFWHNSLIGFFRKANLNFDDIFIARQIENNIDLSNFFEPYQKAKFLPYLETMINDHCNLNCKACGDYSALVKKPHFYDLKKFTADFEQLHKFIDDIATIRILGGEPLLNPNVNEYIKVARKFYPRARLYLVTNALLLHKMPEEFFQTVRDANAIIFISLYPPMLGKIDELKNFLQGMNVGFFVTPPNEKFFMNQILKPHDYMAEMFARCSVSTCTILYDGKISACCKPFTTKYFNACFGKNIPTDDMLDLYEPDISTEKIKKFLVTPFERCRYCVDSKFVEWKTMSHPATLSDWIVDL